MNDFDMISVTARLRTMVENIIEEKLTRLPLTIPAKVSKRTKSTVNVIPVITFGMDAAQIDDVPLAKSPYFNEPVKEGDYGLLIPCSYFYQSLVTDNLNTIEQVIPTITTGNYIFLPMARVSDNPSNGVESEIWSKGKSRTLRVTDDRIELGDDAGYATEWTALNTQFQTFVTAINTALAAKLDGGGTPGTLTLDLSSAKKETVTL